MSNSEVAQNQNQQALVLVVGVDVNKSVRQSFESEVVFQNDSSTVDEHALDTLQGVKYILISNTVIPGESRRIIDLALSRQVKIEVEVTPGKVSSRLQQLFSGRQTVIVPIPENVEKTVVQPPITTVGERKMKSANKNTLVDVVRAILGKRSPHTLTKEDREEILAELAKQGRPTSMQQVYNALSDIRKESGYKKITPSQTTPKVASKRKTKQGRKAAQLQNLNGNSELISRLDTWLAEGQEIRNAIAKNTEGLQQLVNALDQTLKPYR